MGLAMLRLCYHRAVLYLLLGFAAFVVFIAAAPKEVAQLMLAGSWLVLLGVFIWSAVAPLFGA
jgi:hypothetical protein